MRKSSKIWINIVAAAVATVIVAITARGAVKVFLGPTLVTEPIAAPVCDTTANGAAAVEQLASRMKAGVASTDCDLEQLDHVASLARTCEVELHMDRVNRMHCENELHDCESAPMDLEGICDHREPSRLEAAIDAIYDCAEASR